MRSRRGIGDQRGFTLAEILVAGMILVVALIPIVRMFDTSFAGIMSSSRAHKTVALAQSIMERIKSMPYYVPFDDEMGKMDIDDYFWGERNPQYANPANGSGPDWDAIPEVTLPAYAYGSIEGNKDFRAGVRVCYQDNATQVSEMKSTWGPMKVGNDRPKDKDNRSINLLVVQVNIYAMRDEVEVLEHKAEAIVTASEAIYNLGVSRITVDGPEAIQGTSSDAAAHWPERDANVTIEGWGFDPGAPNFEVKLARPDYNDVTVAVNKVTSTDTVIKGTVKLYNSTPGSPWGGKAPIGYWSVKVRQEIVSSYLYNGFICEYPRPIISDYGNDPNGPFSPVAMSKTGHKEWGALHLRVTGGRFINIPNFESASVRLVQDVEENPVTVPGVITSITAPKNGYIDSGCVILATFDINEAPPGDYRIEVINTQAEVVGHVSTLSGTYTIEGDWPATIEDFSPDPGSGFFENYYDIPSTITGTNLSDARRVEIRNEDGVIYDITGGCTLGGETQIPVQLNLIDCDNEKSWELFVYNSEGAFLTRDFDITLGPAITLPVYDPQKAVRIERYYWSVGVWVSDDVSEETTTTLAGARRSEAATARGALFEVKGMGFPLNDDTALEVYGDGSSWTNDYGVITDRDAKVVMIRSNIFTMPDATWSDGGIRVKHGEYDWYESPGTPPRWELVDP
ncbi:MAG: hypothetical protein PHS26_01890 [Actinomycetota bacterium]|nr:hypothetical protein [Actinomycetota bacterium]